MTVPRTSFDKDQAVANPKVRQTELPPAGNTVAKARQFESNDMKAVEVSKQYLRNAITPYSSKVIRALYGKLEHFSHVILSHPLGLLLALGHLAASEDSPFTFQESEEGAGLAGVHHWALMLPTSSRVPYPVYETIIGTNYEMLVEE